MPAMKTNNNEPSTMLTLEAGHAVMRNSMTLSATGTGTFIPRPRETDETPRPAAEPDIRNILEMLLDGLGIAGEIPNPGFRATLSVPALLALAALIDAMRQAQLRSLLNRNPDPEWMADFLDVWACLHRGVVEDDFRWLTAIVRNRLPDEVDVTQTTLSTGLAELQDAGLAVRQDAAWALAEAHVPVLTELMATANFGSCFARHNGAQGEETVKLVFLRTPAALWALHFGNPSGSVNVFTLTVDRLGSLVAELAARLTALAAQDGKAGPPPVPEVPVAGTGMPAAKFCSDCGQAVTPGDRFCAACGHAL